MRKAFTNLASQIHLVVLVYLSIFMQCLGSLEDAKIATEQWSEAHVYSIELKKSMLKGMIMSWICWIPVDLLVVKMGMVDP